MSVLYKILQDIRVCGSSEHNMYLLCLYSDVRFEYTV